MSTKFRTITQSACFVVLMCIGSAPDSPLNIAFFGEANAIIGVAPGGSVVRRRAIAGTAMVASSSANASAAAAANAEASAAAAANAEASAAAAANANAAPAPAQPAAPAVGTIVTTLPPGCTAKKLNNIDYQLCGSTYYTTAMMGTNVVFVVAQP